MTSAMVDGNELVMNVVVTPRGTFAVEQTAVLLRADESDLCAVAATALFAAAQTLDMRGMKYDRDAFFARVVEQARAIMGSPHACAQFVYQDGRRSELLSLDDAKLETT
jgi:hypothetical protein